MSHYVKSESGYDIKVPSQGQVNFNTVGASAGIASFLGLDARNLLSGMGWGGRGCGHPAMAEMGVSRFELGMQNELAVKDSKIALLESTIYTNNNMLEVYKYFDGKLSEIYARLAAQDVRNQGVADAIREVSKDIDYKIALEAERRECADNKIVGYVNGTFAPKLITGFTADATSTTSVETYNPLCCCGNGR